MSLEAIVSTWGLPGIALGAALEGDTVTFLGGALAHHGVFPYEAAALAAALGASVSDHLSFFAGRYLGRTELVGWVLRRGPVARLHARLNGNPTLFILAFRFFSGVRVPSAMLVGTTAIAWPRFSALNILAALIWAHVITALGYGAGSVLQSVIGHLPLWQHLRILLPVAVLLGLAMVVAGRRLRRRRAAAPGG